MPSLRRKSCNQQSSLLLHSVSQAHRTFDFDFVWCYFRRLFDWFIFIHLPYSHLYKSVCTSYTFIHFLLIVLMVFMRTLKLSSINAILPQPLGSSSLWWFIQYAWPSWMVGQSIICIIATMLIKVLSAKNFNISKNLLNLYLWLTQDTQCP